MQAVISRGPEGVDTGPRSVVTAGSPFSLAASGLRTCTALGITLGDMKGDGFTASRCGETSCLPLLSANFRLSVPLQEARSEPRFRQWRPFVYIRMSYASLG